MTCGTPAPACWWRSGRPPGVVTEQRGYSTIKLTMDTYSHVLPELQRQGADKMDGLFGGGAD